MTIDIKQILEEHRLWLIGRGGRKADLSGANLSGANLSGANLSGADLSNTNLTSTNLLTANLTGTKTPYPIYQFFVNKFNGVATSATLRIGCEEHDWDTWLQEYNNIGKKAVFSEREIDQHWQVIKLYYKLLTGKDVL